MDTNKLTTKSRDAVSAALRSALTAGNPYAEPSHLLHALLQVPGNTIAPLITAVGADPAVVAAAAQGAIAKLPSAKGTSVSQPSLSGSFARVLAGLPRWLVVCLLRTLTHLTAVSGANLTLLLAFLLTVARWIGLRGWNLRLLGLAGVIIFVVLCRTEPSVLRASAMGLVALVALGSGSRAAGVRNLAVASVILLLLDPFLSRSVGFTLSVVACAGIV